MNYAEKVQVSSAIVNKAKELGASLCGLASVEELKKAPSFTLAPKLPQADVGSRENSYGLKPGEVYWPEGAATAVVIALAHPESEPELDWWYGKVDPPGNRVLARINKELSQWIEETLQIRTFPLAYHVEKGGLFLKDASVLAGLGCIGRNNLLVTPEFGSQVRLRAMLLAQELPATGPKEFDPCGSCDVPCLELCPQGSFKEKIYSEAEMGQQILPGRTGMYNRSKCNIQMNSDIEVAKAENVPEVSAEPVKIIKYCRNCELACPVGR